jgi:hypothetical protein
MRQAVTFRAGVKIFRSGFSVPALPCAAILLLLALASCGGNSCLTFTWNSPGPISTGNKSCVLNVAKGNVSVRIAATAPSTAGPMAPNFQHVFITLQGIEAHPAATADENSPGWEELAPDLARDPVQIDLMAQPVGSCSSNPISRALVPASPYRRLRLRLVPNHPDPNAAVPKQNACGEMGFHCVVTANGAMHPLTLDQSSLELRIPAERIAGGMFQVLPDTKTDLALEFNPYASLAVASGESVRLVPVFTVDSLASCDLLRASER